MSPNCHRPAHSVAILVFLLLLLISISSVTAAGGEEAATETVAREVSNHAERVRELIGRRTATSNTFLLENGSLETELFEVPVNYKDDNGDWRPIEQELQQAPDGTVVNGANAFEIRLPEDLNEAPAKIALGDQWVSQMPIQIGVKPGKVDQGVASYETAGGAAELQYSAFADGLKENIVLAGPSAPSTYRFELDASIGVTPTLAESGSIDFTAENGDRVARVPAPVMADSAGTPAPAGAVKYSLEADEESWKLTVEADPEWLQAGDRSWPVTIDPTLKIDSGTLDCVITNDGTNTSFCSPLQSYRNVKANYQSSGTDLFARTLVRFDLSSLPASAAVTSATVGIFAGSEAKNVSQVDLYDINRPWGNGVNWTYAQTNYSGANKWTTLGGDYGKYLPNRPASPQLK